MAELEYWRKVGETAQGQYERKLGTVILRMADEIERLEAQRNVCQEENEQLRDELASRTDTLDALADGKIAEYWRTAFYQQQEVLIAARRILAELEEQDDG